MFHLVSLDTGAAVVEKKQGFLHTMKQENSTKFQAKWLVDRKKR